MRTRLGTPGQAATWRIHLDTGSHRLLHLARLMLDAEDAAKQFANRLRHVKRKDEPPRLAALAASGLPVAVDPSLTQPALPRLVLAVTPPPTWTVRQYQKPVKKREVTIDAIRSDAVAERDELAQIEAKRSLWRGTTRH